MSKTESILNEDFYKLMPSNIKSDTDLLEFAKKMSADGFSVEDISVLTGLSIVDIKQLLD